MNLKKKQNGNNIRLSLQLPNHLNVGRNNILKLKKSFDDAKIAENDEFWNDCIGKNILK